MKFDITNIIFSIVGGLCIVYTGIMYDSIAVAICAISFLAGVISQSGEG